MTRFFISIEDGIKHVVNSIYNCQGGEIFIPKMPSLRVTDLAKTIDKNIKFNVIGIRPGEKLHETLISKDNQDKILEYKNYFTILPTINLFLSNEKLYHKNYSNEKGKLLKNQIEYNSFTNPKFYKIQEIKKILKLNNV